MKEIDPDVMAVSSPEQDDRESKKPWENALFGFCVLIQPDLSVELLPLIELGDRRFSLDGPFHSPSLVSMACHQVIQDLAAARAGVVVESVLSSREHAATTWPAEGEF